MADSKSNEDALEEAFRLIGEGNEQVEEKENWKAADSYSRAQVILQQLAEEAAPKANKSDEQAKIAALYRQQWLEYLQRARALLISALQQETADDQKTGASQEVTDPGSGTPSLLASLSEEECLHRMKLFGRLFAKELDDPKKFLEQESSLEARLRELNDSLPAAFKSEKERVRDLNRGLARLGLTLIPDASDTEQRRGRLFGMADAVPKSENEQVDLIIAQAKDEVAVATGGGPVANDSALAEAAAAGTLMVTGGLIPDATDVLLNHDDDDSVEFSTEDEDANLTPEICTDMHNKLVAAQASLSELVALFDIDQDDDFAIEFEQARGKKVLKDARLLLRQVAEKWAAC